MAVDAADIGNMGRVGRADKIGVLGRVATGIGVDIVPIIGGTVVAVRTARIIGGWMVRARKRFDH